MIKVELLQDFGIKEKGVSFMADSQLASSLINRGIAKVFEETPKVEKAPKKAKEPKEVKE